MGDPIKDLYNSVKASGIFLDENDFRDQLSKNPKDVYGILSSDKNVKGLFLDYNDFESTLGLKKKDVAQKIGAITGSALGSSLAASLGSKIGNVATTSTPTSLKEETPTPEPENKLIRDMGGYTPPPIVDKILGISRKPQTLHEIPQQDDLANIDIDYKDPVKSIVDPLQAHKKEIFDRNIAIESTGQNKFQKQAASDEVNHTNDIIFNVQQSVFPTVQAAKNWRTNNADADENNMTAKIADDIIIDDKKVQNALNDNHGKLDDAALQYYRSFDNDLARQLMQLHSEGLKPPPELMATLEQAFLKNRSVREMASKNRDFNNQVKEAQTNFFQRYPEAHTKKLIEDIQQGREDFGYNNWFMNIPGGKSSEEIANSLLATGKWNRFDMDYFQKNVLPLIKAGALDIKTPGLVENTIRSAEKTITDVPKSIAEVTGMRNLVNTPGQLLQKNLNEDYSQTADPKYSGFHNFSHATGNIAGMLIPMAGEVKAIRGLELFDDARKADQLATGLTFYHDIFKHEQENHPDNPLLAHLSAAIQTAAWMTGGVKLPELSREAFTKISPEINTALEQLQSGAINNAAATSKITDLIIKAGKGVGKTISTATHVGATASLTQSISDVLNGKFDANNAVASGAGAFETMILGTPLLSFMGSKGRRQTAADVLDEIALRPDYYRKQLNDMAEKDPTQKGRVDELLTNLDHLLSVKKELESRTDLTDGQKKVYQLLSLSEKILNDKKKSVNDKGLQQPHEQQLQQIQQEKQVIIPITETKKTGEQTTKNGVTVIKPEPEAKTTTVIRPSENAAPNIVELKKPESETEAAAASTEVPQPERTDVQKMLHKAIDDGKLPEMYRGAVDSNPEGVLKEIAQQALNITANGKEHRPELTEESRIAAETTFGRKLVDTAIDWYEKNKQPEQPKSISDNLRSTAEKIRTEGLNSVLPDWLKIDTEFPGTTDQQSFGGKALDKVIAKSLDVAADIIDKTKDVSKAIEEGFKHLRDYYAANTTKFDEAKLKEQFAEKVKQMSEQPDQSGRTDKAILNRLYNSEHISDYSKEQLQKEGFKYKPQSKEEARTVGKGIIDELGTDDAVSMAEGNKFGGGINSAIFSDSLDRTFQSEKDATDPLQKKQLAQKWADIAIRYDKWARGLGRDISQIGEFYKSSPIGVQIAEGERRRQAFDEFFKGKEKDFKKVWEALNGDEEFKKFFKEKVEEAMKNERATTRMKRRDKIKSIFDKAKIDTTGTASASIIPPHIWNATVEVMKQAALAGEKLVDIIEQGVAYIKNNHGDFDEDAFRKEWNQRLQALDPISDPLEKYKAKLRGDIDNLNEQIANKQREVKEKNKTELDDEAKDLLKQRDELKKKLQEVAPVEKTEEFKKNFIDKFRKNLKGLSKEMQEDVIRKSFTHLVENGALEYDDFKKIIADTMGLGDLTKEQKEKIEQYVSNINSVEEAGAAAREKRTPEALNNYYKAHQLAEKSATELAAMLKTKVDLAQRFASIMQLNTLTAVSLVKNLSYNVWWQLFGRAPKAAIMSLMDTTIFGAGKLLGYNVKPDFNIINAQAPFFKKLVQGFKESGAQLFTGSTNKDYFQKEIYSPLIKPLESAKNLVRIAKGEQYATGKEVTDYLMQATIGMPAEAVARVLNLGDKPFRYAAEGSTASAEANRLGLKGFDRQLFMAFPKEEAIRHYMKQGLSAEKAQAKAEVIEKNIIREGEEAVFQQSNLIHEGLKWMGKGFDSFSKDKNKLTQAANGLRKVIGTAVMPFSKIPMNVGWHFFNLAVPEVAIGQGVFFAVRAAMKHAEGNEVARLDLIQAKKWFAHAGVGIGLIYLSQMLHGIGAFRGGNNKNEQIKESTAEKTYQQQHSVNVTKLMRYMQGGSTEDQDGDINVDLNWFGPIGSVMNVQANIDEHMTDEQREKGISYMQGLGGRMENGAYEAIDQGAFSGYMAGLNAYLSGNQSYINSFMLQLMNMGINTVQTGTMAQLSRASVPYDYKIKAQDFWGELENNMAARSSMYRKLTGHYPPAAVTIWGDKAMRTDPPLMRMFGMSRQKMDNFAQPLYKDYEKTGDLNLFPPQLSNKITVNGEQVALTPKQSLEYAEYVGKQRKYLVGAFVNDQATVAVKTGNADEGYSLDVKKYSEMTDKEKSTYLQKLYQQALENGQQLFFTAHPELMPKEKTKQEKKVDEKVNKINKPYFQTINQQ